jgi:hypothetical protein
MKDKPTCLTILEMQQLRNFHAEQILLIDCLMAVARKNDINSAPTAYSVEQYNYAPYHLMN